jgi:hypothetical protein
MRDGRDLAVLVVPPAGALIATGDRYEPFRLAGPDGAAVSCLDSFSGDGAPGDLGKRGHAQVHGVRAAGHLVELGELVPGCLEADLQALGLAGPAFPVGLGDALDQVLLDLGDAVPLRRGRPQQGAAQAVALVDAGVA